MRTLLVTLLILLAVLPARADVPLHDIVQAEDARNGTAIEVFLDSPDVAVRARAVRALGRLQDPSHIARLLDRASKDELAVRAEAIFALGQLDSALAEAPLLELLPGARTLEERLLIVAGLGKTCGPDGAGHARLVALLADPDPAVRAAAASAVEDLAYRRRRVAPRWEAPQADAEALIALLAAAQPAPVRAAAAGALWRLAWVPGDAARVEPVWRTQALPGLVGLLHDADVDVRLRALQAIAEVAAPASLPSEVGRALADKDWRVRVAAVDAIGRAAPERAWPLLLQQQLQDPQPLVVLASLRALESLARRHPATSLRGVYGVYLDASRPLQVRAEALRIALAHQAFDGRPAVQPFGATGPAAPEVRVPDEAWKKEWRLRRALVQGAAAFLQAGLRGVPDDSLVSQYQATVRPFLQDVDARVRVAVIEAVGGLLTAATESRAEALAAATRKDLLAMVGDKDAIVRTVAADVLADQGVREAVPAIVETLRGMKPAADVEAMTSLIDALGRLKDPRALALLETLSTSPDATVARAAARACGAITGTPPRIVKVPAAVTPVPAAAFALLDAASRPGARPLRAVLHTRHGDMTLRLFTTEAPLTVYNFVKLARAGYFDGITFHRVVPNFVVQGGDPRGDGWGGPGYTIRCEYNPLTYGRGTVGMALAGKDTGGSQFFITHAPQPRLNGRYTVFGQLVGGGDVLDRITEGDVMKVEILEP